MEPNELPEWIWRWDQDLIRKPVPAAQRARIWSAWLGADEFSDSAARFDEHCAGVGAADLRKGTLHQIEVDLPRTFPDDERVRAPAFQAALKGILVLFSAIHREDVDYVQGMSHVAAVMLIVTDVDAQLAFCLFEAVCGRALRSYFEIENGWLLNATARLALLLERWNPLLHSRLKALGGETLIWYTPRPILCLFSQLLPISECTKLWDLLFFHHFYSKNASPSKAIAAPLRGAIPASTTTSSPDSQSGIRDAGGIAIGLLWASFVVLELNTSKILRASSLTEVNQLINSSLAEPSNSQSRFCDWVSSSRCADLWRFRELFATNNDGLLADDLDFLSTGNWLQVRRVYHLGIWHWRYFALGVDGQLGYWKPSTSANQAEHGAGAGARAGNTGAGEGAGVTTNSSAEIFDASLPVPAPSGREVTHIHWDSNVTHNILPRALHQLNAALAKQIMTHPPEPQKQQHQHHLHQHHLQNVQQQQQQQQQKAASAVVPPSSAAVSADEQAWKLQQEQGQQDARGHGHEHEQSATPGGNTAHEGTYSPSSDGITYSPSRRRSNASDGISPDAVLAVHSTNLGALVGRDEGGEIVDEWELVDGLRLEMSANGMERPSGRQTVAGAEAGSEEEGGEAGHERRKLFVGGYHFGDLTRSLARFTLGNGNNNKASGTEGDEKEEEEEEEEEEEDREEEHGIPHLGGLWRRGAYSLSQLAQVKGYPQTGSDDPRAIMLIFVKGGDTPGDADGKGRRANVANARPSSAAQAQAQARRNSIASSITQRLGRGSLTKQVELWARSDIEASRWVGALRACIPHYASVDAPASGNIGTSSAGGGEAATGEAASDVCHSAGATSADPATKDAQNDSMVAAKGAHAITAVAGAGASPRASAEGRSLFSQAISGGGGTEGTERTAGAGHEREGIF
jgi:hypothetical protein